MKTYLYLEAIVLVLFAVCCSDDDGRDLPESPLPDNQENVIQVETSIAPIIETSGGTAKITFTAKSNWQASVVKARSALDWISVKPTSGVAGKHELAVTTTENTEYTERNAGIKLSSGTESQILTFTQKQKDAILLTSDKIEISAAGGEVNIQFQTNVDYDYQIECPNGWLHDGSKGTRGLENRTLTLTAEENDATVPRSATVHIISAGLEETVSVYQLPSDPMLILTDTLFTVPAAGDTIQIEVKSNCDYTVELPDVDWLTEDVGRSLSSYTHRFVVEPNETGESRETKIGFVQKNTGKTEDITVVQKQRGAVLFENKMFELGPQEQTLVVKFITNTDLNIMIPDSVQSWINILDSRKMYPNSVKFNIKENFTGKERKANLFFTSKDKMISDSLTVHQQGQTVRYFVENVNDGLDALIHIDGIIALYGNAEFNCGFGEPNRNVIYLANFNTETGIIDEDKAALIILDDNHQPTQMYQNKRLYTFSDLSDDSGYMSCMLSGPNDRIIEFSGYTSSIIDGSRSTVANPNISFSKTASAVFKISDFVDVAKDNYDYIVLEDKNVFDNLEILEKNANHLVNIGGMVINDEQITTILDIKDIIAAEDMEVKLKEGYLTALEYAFDEINRTSEFIWGTPILTLHDVDVLNHETCKTIYDISGLMYGGFGGLDLFLSLKRYYKENGNTRWKTIGRYNLPVYNSYSSYDMPISEGGDYGVELHLVSRIYPSWHLATRELKFKVFDLGLYRYKVNGVTGFYDNSVFFDMNVFLDGDESTFEKVKEFGFYTRYSNAIPDYQPVKNLSKDLTTTNCPYELIISKDGFYEENIDMDLLEAKAVDYLIGVYLVLDNGNIVHMDEQPIEGLLYDCKPEFNLTDILPETNQCLIKGIYNHYGFWGGVCGIQYGTDESMNNEYSVPNQEASIYEIVLEKLEPETKYYFRAFVSINGKRIYVSETETFITSKRDESEENPDSVLKNILMELYDQTDGDNWNNNTNWGSDKPFDQWYGISIDPWTDKWIIDLHDNNLKGFIDLQNNENTDFSNFSMIYSINIENNQITGIDISGCIGPDVLYCKGNPLTQLNAINTHGLNTVSCDNRNSEINPENLHIDLTEAVDLTNLQCAGSNVSDIELTGCTSLRILYCEDNNLRTLKLFDCHLLKEVYLDDNNLEWLNLSEKKELEVLQANNNELSEITVDGCKQLSYIHLDMNSLIGFTAYDLPQLKRIHLNNNKLSDIYIEKCPNLQELMCENNQLQALDVSRVSSISQLIFSNNQVRELNITGCKNIEYIKADKNNLSTIDFTQCPELQSLKVSNNVFHTLDVNGLTELRSIHCHYNDMTDIKLDGCTKLETLRCVGNQLTDMPVEHCTNLKELECGNNKILKVITEFFQNIRNFSYDKRYYYHKQSDGSIKVEDTGRGWWYEGEPEKMEHKP